jgi:hypothetical protein
MHTITAPAVPDVKQGRSRALCAAAGALAAALAWILEVPVLGIHLTFRFGAGHIQTIAIGQVIGVTGRLAARLAADRPARAAHPARPAPLDHHRAGNSGRVTGAAAGRRNDHLSRRRADRDAPDRRGRRHPRHGPHGPDTLTALSGSRDGATAPA